MQLKTSNSTCQINKNVYHYILPEWLFSDCETAEDVDDEELIRALSKRERRSVRITMIDHLIHPLKNSL